MTRLTEEERRELREVAERPVVQPHRDATAERFVAPTPEARLRYIQFATQASRLHRPAPFRPMRGDNWRL